ncbi:MAG: lamin tail domain-containing protein [Haloarculaceae archaeon]
MDDRDTIHHSDLVVEEVRENPPGRDDRHLDREYVTFENAGTDALTLSGWAVENEGGETFTFPEDTVLAPGDRITLHSGSGENTESDVFWGADHPLWRNAGDTVTVRDADGVVRIRETYNE